MNIGKLLCEYRNLDELKETGLKETELKETGLKETELKETELKETEFNQFNQKLDQSKKNKGIDDKFIIFQWPWII
tara:strand:- start:578 stop:805 length:228 start_codon:yes stop_codon:yes gene_type:complete